MKVLSPAEARSLDEKTIAAGTPGIVLMERAAAAVAREIARVLTRRPHLGARVVALCGTGNNGGDGFETARLLLRSPRVASVETVLVGNPERLSGDVRTTYERLCDAGGEVRFDLEALRRATLVVDALFGTGLSRPLDLDGLEARAVRFCAEGGVFVVSVDLPSGLHGGTGEIPGVHLTADLTVTFGHPKTAHVDLPAAGFCGRLVVTDIGLVPAEKAAGPDVVVSADVAPLFRRRHAESHKGTFGRLLVVGGSDGMAGAPALAARAALRAGAGLVVVAAPDGVRGVVHGLVAEATTRPTEAEISGDALAVGPGLGTSDAARVRFERAIASDLPAVFDADALNLASGNPEMFWSREPETVLTPHPAEAGRLLGSTAEAVNADRVEAATTLARRSGAVVVLKGFRSVVAAPDGRHTLVLAGGPAMAKGGAGDVLTGIVGALLARGLGAWDAARAGAWLHGSAGDLAREALGEESVVATDLVELLPEVFELLRSR